MPANFENSATATGLEKVSFPISKNVQTTTQLHSSLIHKVKLKILKVRLQQYMNQEFPDVQAGFRKGREVRDQIESSKEHESSRKTSISALLSMPKPLTVWTTTNWKILQAIGIPDHWPAPWEICMQVKKQQLELDMKQDWFQIGKGVRKGCILSSCLSNLYVEYIMWNAGLDKAQAEVKIARRNNQ